MWFPNRSNINQAEQAQMASYCKADVCICFSLCKLLVFSCLRKKQVVFRKFSQKTTMYMSHAMSICEFQTRSDTKWPVQSQKKTRGWKFPILERRGIIPSTKPKQRH